MEKPASAPACEPTSEPMPEPQPTPLPTVTLVMTSNPEPKAQPTQPHRSERATHPSWRKIASDSQKVTNTRQKVDNKVCAEQPMLDPPGELSEPHSCPPDHNIPTNEAEMVNLAYLAAHSPITPLNYKEAIQCPQSAEWNKAMEEEFDNYMHRKTWELVPLPKD